MFGATEWLKDLCARTGYCVAYSDLEESTLSLVCSAFLAVALAGNIFVKKLDGRKHELFKLQDDMFDIVLLRVYGVVMLALVAASWKWQNETVQIDVLFFHIALAMSALAINNNKMGLFFVAMSYSSWYGWFRLLMVTPFGTDFHLLVQPQWLAALLAYTAPTLISNLKYPTLLDNAMSRLSYGMALFGVILAAHAGVLWFDAIVVSYDLVPQLTENIVNGAYFRLYGANVTPITRISYFTAMSVLQYITCQVPHLMTNKEDLFKQLREQQSVQDESTSNTSPNEDSANNNNIGQRGDINLSDIPDDCVEIAAEAAIEMQERVLRSREREKETGAAHTSDSGIHQRKTAAAK